MPKGVREEVGEHLGDPLAVSLDRRNVRLDFSFQTHTP